MRDEPVMDESGQQAQSQAVKKGFSGWQVLGIVLLAMVVTAGISYWVLSQYVFVEAFEPVELNTSEQRTLQSKLQVLGVDARQPSNPAAEPEPYSEEGASREVRLSERELNGMLANNTDLARKLAVDLSQDLLSVVLLVPLEEGFPVLGGQTLRVHAGVELAVNNDKRVVRLKGVSVMGVPLPNAWLGNLKNVDLVNEFADDPGFWRSFSEGIDSVHVEDGQLVLKLRE
ncbi:MULTISPECIES: hypothetical protein [Halomonadaceae]|nr:MULTISPECIES: hypothetical protein [Halomonas]